MSDISLPQSAANIPLGTRARAIVWGFLGGVIVLEGWGILASFHAGAGLPAALLRYTFSHSAQPAIWGLAALIALFYAAYCAVGSRIVRTHMLQPATWGPYAMIRLVAILAALISGFFEEAFFRRTLMDFAMHHGASIAMQIALSALAFGAVHAIWGVAAGNLRGALNAMTATGILGAALALLYVMGGRSIGPCIASHVAINLLIEPWLVMTAATNGWSHATAKRV